MMQQNKAGIAFAFGVIVVLATSSCESSPGKRRHYYAHFSKDLRDLAGRDFETISQLRSFKEQWHDDQPLLLLKIINRYLEDFDNGTRNTSHVSRTQYVEEIVRNPLAIFRLMHRLVYLLRYIMNAKPGSAPGLPLEELKSRFEDDRTFLDYDLMGVADGILRIHLAYSLNASVLVTGKISGIETRTRLTALDCLYIGRVAKSRKQYALAVEWLNEARRLAKLDQTVDIPTVQAELVALIHEHDKSWEDQEFTNAAFFAKTLKYLHLAIEGNVPKVRDILHREFAGKGRSSSYWPVNIPSLCSGANFNTPEASSHLFCWLEFKANQVFAIGPLKMEFLSRNPDVVQIHDAFSEKQMNETMLTADASENFAKLGDEAEKHIRRKVEEMTGLQNTEDDALDDMELTNHVPGGHKGIHVDSDLEMHGPYTTKDRIATAMIYLNNVEEGGRTVFPTSFAAAAPKKGSAIFWYNSFSDGTPDFSTAHSDCPVVLGEKWVAYKWFYGQAKTQKCLLEPKQRFQVLVNGKALPVPSAFNHELVDEEELETNPLSVASEVSEEYEIAESGHIKLSKYAYAPSSSLKSLIQLDWDIYQHVKRIVSANENPVNLQAERYGPMIFGYLQDFNETVYNLIDETNATDMESVAKLAWNPLAAYRTFWRFENYVKTWLKRESEDGEGQLIKRIRGYIGQVYNTSDGPHEMELGHAMSGILNLQFVHDLKSYNIAKGNVAGIDVGILLSARQCEEIGIHAMGRKFYYQAIDWMEAAVNRILLDSDTTVGLEEAKIQLETAKKVHDKLMASSEGEDLTFFYTDPVATLKNWKHLQTRKEVQYQNDRGRPEKEFANVNAMGVCQGKTHQTAEKTSKLFCWYEFEIHPYFRIGPIKVEIFSMFPQAEVVLYHDVFGEKLSASLQNDANRRHEYFKYTHLTGTNPNYRLQSASYMHQNSSEETRQIAKLVNTVTALNPGHEHSLMFSYTPGGHFSAHHDSLNYDGVKGDYVNIATFMLYVSDEVKGGETAFSQAGVYVTPKKGSALLWYNLLSSGSRDDLAYHGGCPVIFGEKRVVTHFVRFVEQRHLQCHSDPTRRIEVLVNGKSKYPYL